MRCLLRTPSLLGASLLISASFGLFCQTSTTQLSGTVSDTTAASVPGASVTAVNEATGLKYSVVTTDAGLYAFPSIPAGSYALSVDKTGFKRFQLTKIVLQINTPATVDAKLDIGAATETVMVFVSVPAGKSTEPVVAV